MLHRKQIILYLQHLLCTLVHRVNTFSNPDTAGLEYPYTWDSQQQARIFNAVEFQLVDNFPPFTACSLCASARIDQCIDFAMGRLAWCVLCFDCIIKICQPFVIANSVDLLQDGTCKIEKAVFRRLFITALQPALQTLRLCNRIAIHLYPGRSKQPAFNRCTRN